MKPKCYSYIRFSSPEQKKGDSLRRQNEYAEKWAQKNGFELDDTLRMQDEGLSAFRGAHITRGALGQYLDLVEKGKVQKGSVLIVEALDRLSRENIWAAVDLFRDLMRAGIKLVLSEDGKDFTYESIQENPQEFLGCVNEFILGHRESRRKSDRLKKTWEQKRTDIDKKKLTGRAPAWLKMSKDLTGFEKIQDRCKIIKKIFQMKLSGKSPHSIEKELNRTLGIWKPQGRKTNKPGWHKFYIDKILRNRAVIGEFQPHKMIVVENKKTKKKEKKRQPVGDPLPNYFPAIVPMDLFYAVQEQIRKNKKSYHGGRVGKVNNLFSHITTCGYCGGVMHYVDKGKPPRGGKYLICDHAKRKIGCKYFAWRYDEFESDIFRFISNEIDVSQLLPDYEQIESEVDLLQREKSSIQGQLNKVKSEIENLSESIATTQDKRIRELLEGKLADRFDEKELFEKEETEAETKINDLKQINGSVQERISNVKELFETMRDLKDQDEDKLIELRIRLRQMLRNLIEGIKLYPGGYKNKEHVNELHPSEKRAIYYEGIDNKDFRFYQVDLKGCRAFKRGWYTPETYEKLKELEHKKEETRVGFLM